MVYYASAGDNLELECQVNAYPAKDLTVKWTFVEAETLDDFEEKELSR